MSAQKLYTPEMLGLAVELARWPLAETLTFRGDARSPSCGSTLALALALDEEQRIEQIGMQVRACAVGQAAAAIFARHAAGRGAAEIDAALDRLDAWLAGEGAMPDWPDLELIAAASDYPGRHGAILLPWRAASSALSTGASAG